ncbi:hypothetical protein CE11_01216 [Megavirus courdo11]|nr:hypothetical protein CE11_01216 [Megavirus courdo11]
MTDYMAKHTYCYKCGLKVIPDVLHHCEKRESFVPKNDDTFWCAHCQSTTIMPSGHKKPHCNNCGKLFHSGISNPVETVIHNVGERQFNYQNAMNSIYGVPSWSNSSININSYGQSTHTMSSYYDNQRVSMTSMAHLSPQTRISNSGAQRSSSDWGESFVPYSSQSSYW